MLAACKTVSVCHFTTVSPIYYSPPMSSSYVLSEAKGSSPFEGNYSVFKSDESCYKGSDEERKTAMTQARGLAVVRDCRIVLEQADEIADCLNELAHKKGVTVKDARCDKNILLRVFFYFWRGSNWFCDQACVKGERTSLRPINGDEVRLYAGAIKSMIKPFDEEGQTNEQKKLLLAIRKRFRLNPNAPDFDDYVALFTAISEMNKIKNLN